MAINVHYRLLSARGIALPLAVTAGALAVLPYFSGLPLSTLSRTPAAAQPTPGVQRFTQEVYVPNVARGCRWQPSADPAIQIADCGDDSESVRVVFKDGRATEYRLIARQDPNAPPPSAQSAGLTSGVAGVFTLQPSQPGRSVPNSSAPPLRVTVTAGN